MAGALKAWTGAAWEFVGNVLGVRDEANSQAEPATTSLRFPDGTVRAQGSGVVSIREVPAGACGVSAYNSAAQNLTTGASTPLALNSEDFDTDGFHDTGSNTSRLTVPAGLGGYYLIVGQPGRWDSSVAGSHRECWLRKNGATNLSGESHRKAGGGDVADTTAGVLSQVAYLAAGEYVELIAYQDSGGTRTIGFSSSNREAGSTLAMYRLSTGTIGETIGVSCVGAATSLTNGVSAGLAMATETFDTDGFHSGSGTLWTVPAGLGGRYLVWADVEFASHATGQRFTYLVPSAGGPAIYHSSTASGDVVRHSLAGVMQLAAGATVQLQGYQNSGGALNCSVINAGMVLLATTGVPRGYREGTAFPFGPVSGDYFRRTDLRGGMLFKYDGTRWLSAQLFTTDFWLFPMVASQTFISGTLPRDLDIYLERWDLQTFQSTNTPSGSHNFAFTMESYKNNNTVTTHATITTTTDAASTWVNHDQASLNAVVATGTGATDAFTLRLVGTMTGTQNCYLSSKAYWRLIGV